MSEILGTLFKYLVALLGVGAVVAVLYQVLGSNKTQNAIADMTQLQTNIQALYSGQPTFTSLTNTVAVSGRLAPAGMISGTSLINAWSGAVSVKVNGSNAARFDMSTAGVPQDACAKVIGGQASAVSLSVNGGTALTPPIDAGAAVTACNAAANTIVFTYAH
jgi:type II secretory pathway pseudopilin PulG